MPKREDIKKILIIGSGPIIIGQACEFDYSGTQACKALRKLGYEIVLVNSNPATIMTDPGTADVTYIEPLNVERVSEIIRKERPDAVLPNLGGQSGLNLCLELWKAGVLDEYNVKVIGVKIDAIERGEDRIAFKEAMKELGIDMPRSAPAYSVEEAKAIVKELGYPVVIRPAFTMGGAGGGFVHNDEELETIVSRGIQASIVGQVLVEESILGWEELELEIVRDSKGQMITVCFIENIDPLGVHTGDSFCAAPMLTISKELQMRLQEQAMRIVESVGVIGGTNVQFAHDPVSDRIVVIEINPRTSRSSALASKATGFPIALVSAMLAAGLTLDEIPCGKYGDLSKYVPDGDYVVIKFAKWAFEKFKGAKDQLTTQMKAVGEVMSIGRTFKEAYQKAIRSLEIGRYGLGHVPAFEEKSLEELTKMLETPTSQRQFILYEALKKGLPVEKAWELTKIKREFLTAMQELIAEEEEVAKYRLDTLPEELLKQAKLDGFADRYLAGILGCRETEVAEKREAIGVVEHWDGVHVSGTQDAAYYYSTYHPVSHPAPVSKNPKKVMVLGGGPNRIGQGIEFDYCCVHSALALRELGYETVMVNCNPETVSTDYDTSDKLYFEPLTFEDVMSIYREENPVGIIAQFGGQTPLNLARALQAAGARILGTSPDSIDLAEDRDQFREMMEKLSMFQRIDGHAPGVTGKSLNAYRLAGIATDHECSTFEQALERVELGFYVQIRQGTAARNLDAIVSGIVREKLPTDRFLFCTDDKHLDDVRKNGHINFCVRRAIELGLRPVEAIRMATFNPAQAYGLKNQGAIAPGYLADLAVLSDLSLVEPEEVYISGQRVWKKGEAYALPNHGCNPFLKRTVKLPELTKEQLKLPVRPDFPVIGIIPGEIVTKKLLMDPPEQDGYFTPVNGLLKIAVVERHGRNGHVAVGIVSGIGLRGGAIGSTIAHDSHNLILVGDNDEDMLAAAKELQRCQGGYTLVSGGKPLMTLPLSIGGLFTNDRKVNVEEIAARMKEMAHDMGVEEGIDPFMALSFLSLPVIPELRIIDAGIYDVTTGELVQ